MNNSAKILAPNQSSTYNTGWLDILQFTLFAMIFVVSATGNILVCLVVALTGRMRTTRNYLLVNLAVSDLTVALLCIPFDVVSIITSPEWPLGDVMCKLLWPSMTLVTNSSAATLAAISYDRYDYHFIYGIIDIIIIIVFYLFYTAVSSNMRFKHR